MKFYLFMMILFYTNEELSFNWKWTKKLVISGDEIYQKYEFVLIVLQTTNGNPLVCYILPNQLIHSFLNCIFSNSIGQLITFILIHNSKCQFISHTNLMMKVERFDKKIILNYKGFIIFSSNIGIYHVQILKRV